MIANKEMTDRQFVYSINLKRAMVECGKIQLLLDDASEAATVEENEYLFAAERTLNFLRGDISVALRNMSVGS
jgi:hypothetical protein